MEERNRRRGEDREMGREGRGRGEVERENMMEVERENMMEVERERI